VRVRCTPVHSLGMLGVATLEVTFTSVRKLVSKMQRARTVQLEAFRHAVSILFMAATFCGTHGVGLASLLHVRQ
jgi:hypothetical protein